jgi:hypothetical protein
MHVAYEQRGHILVCIFLLRKAVQGPEVRRQVLLHAHRGAKCTGPQPQLKGNSQVTFCRLLEEKNILLLGIKIKQIP